MMKPAHENQKPAANARQRFRIINPALQWKLTGLLMLTVFAVSGFLSTLLYGVLARQTRVHVLATLQKTGEPQLWNDAAILIGAAVTFSLVTALAVGIWSLVYSHRICGPIFVLNTWLADLAAGRFPKIRKLRKKDEFKDVHATFAEAVERLKRDRQALLSTLSQVRRLTEEAAGADPEAAREGMEVAAHQLSALCGELADSLGEAGDPSETPASAPQEPRRTAVEEYAESSV